MRRLVLIACVVLIVGLFVTGCGKKETEVKPMQEYRDEAAKTVTKDNVDTELDKITKEINEDTE
ncbi:MAG TPA: hypothetical protein VMY39_03410 [Planctomycetota bacterium]|nr:hypothetical protein [Planctomycetota bacterium]